jgi:hypothetical protein
MTAAKMAKAETAAERYERLKRDQFESFLNESFSAEALKDVQLYEVKAPSGMVFKCRLLDVAFHTNSGSLPLSMMERAVLGGDAEAGDEAAAETFASMSNPEKVAAIQTTARMVQYVAVEPRLIVGEVNGHKNALSVDALTMSDFTCLVQWAKTGTEGGNAAPGLKTFRTRRK